MSFDKNVNHFKLKEGSMSQSMFIPKVKVFGILLQTTNNEVIYSKYFPKHFSQFCFIFPLFSMYIYLS